MIIPYFQHELQILKDVVNQNFTFVIFYLFYIVLIKK